MTVVTIVYVLFVIEYVIGSQEPRAYNGNDWQKVFDDPADPKPFSIVSDSHLRNDTKLFVGIASFRDWRCGRTLFNIFQKAAHPQRVFVGVAQQNAIGDTSCMESYCFRMANAGHGTACPYKDHIRILEVHSLQAKGPTYGRAIQQTLLQDEEFCLQIDAHSDFEDAWDVKMMQMWAQTENEYAVLSTYVPKLQDLYKNVNKRWEVPHLCTVHYTGIQMVRNNQASAAQWLTKPKRTNLWGAGLSFSKCHAERRVLYDPYTPHVFDGEEFSRAARFWTSGYDVYTPSRSYVVHDYDLAMAHAAKNWHRDTKEADDAHHRLKVLLQYNSVHRTQKDIDKLGFYNLGARRSFEQWVHFSGVDTVNQTIDKRTRCFNLKFVPFENYANIKEGDHLKEHIEIVRGMLLRSKPSRETIEKSREFPSIDPEIAQVNDQKQKEQKEKEQKEKEQKEKEQKQQQSLHVTSSSVLSRKVNEIEIKSDKVQDQLNSVRNELANDIVDLRLQLSTIHKLHKESLVTLQEMRTQLRTAKGGESRDSSFGESLLSAISTPTTASVALMGVCLVGVVVMLTANSKKASNGSKKLWGHNEPQKLV